MSCGLDLSMTHLMTREEITALLDKADAHLEKSEYAQGEALGNDVLLTSPEHIDDVARTYCILGEICWETARFEEALTHFDKVLTSAKTSSNLSWQSRALNGMATVEFKRGNYTVALTKAKHA